MTMHALHPDSHTHGLADDCPRCAEHAAHPFESLDDRNLSALTRRTLLWMRDSGDSLPRSDTELVAMRYMERAIVEARALARLGITELGLLALSTFALVDDDEDGKDDRAPTDNEIANRPGVEGGIGYPLGPEPMGEHDWRL